MKAVFSILLPMCYANHMGMAHVAIVADDTQIIIPGDSNYDFDTDNTVTDPSNTSEVYLDLQMDLNMCLVEVIYKYNLSAAIKQTKEIVDDQKWLETMKDLDEQQARDKMAVALEPIAQQLLNKTGDVMVEQIPEEVITWIFDSAVVFAASEGTISQDDAVEFLNPKCEECVEYVQEERIVEVPVEKIVEKIVYKQIPVETIVEKIVRVPVEQIVYVNKTEYVDKIIYMNRTVEKEVIVYVDKPVEVEKLVY